MYFDLFHIIYYFALFVVSLFGLLRFSKIDIGFKWLVSLVFLTLVLEITAKVLPNYYNFSNSILYHFFTLVEYGIYVIIFSKFFNSQRISKILYVSWVVLLIAEVLNTIYYQPLNESNTNIMIFESVLLVFFSLVLFIKIKNSLYYENLLLEGVFWFNSAILVYYSFNNLVWGFHSFKVYNLENPPMIIYKINLLFAAFLYIVYGYSIYLNYKSTQKDKIEKHG